MEVKMNYNEFAQKHGAQKVFYDEDLKFRYQNKSLREYSASIYGRPYQEFPVTAFTSEACYLQWCVQVSGAMPVPRNRDFKQYIRDRLAEAEEEEIPPNMEELAEVEVVVLTILKNCARKVRNFDFPQDNPELEPAEWLFLETAEDSKCGLELYIKYEGLKSKILDQVALGATETKITRKEVVKWLKLHGRHYDKNASVNRRRCAYVLPYSLVEGFESFTFGRAVRPAAGRIHCWGLIYGGRAGGAGVSVYF
jgi:hypothetical protein